VRRILLYTAAGLLPALGLLGASAGPALGQKAVRPPGSILAAPAATECSGDHGTSVHFFKSPSEAARAALKEEKLVFVLHISGLFEEPDFT
jgi:hypothetical protein